MSTSPTQPSKPVLFWTKEEIEVERLFPIRNLIVDHPSPTFPLFDSGSPTPSNTASIDESDATVRPDAASSPNCNDGDSEQPTLSSTASHGCQPPPYSSTPPPVVARRLSISTGSPDGRSISEEAQYLQAISERSQMIPHKAAGDEPPGIAQGLSVDSTCYRCEDEAIHIPGAIQQFGALIALRYDTEGNLKVRIASENTKKVLRYSPHQLFDLESFLDILEPEVLEDFVTRVRHALAIGTNEATQTHLDVFTMSVTSSAGTQVQVWCAIHISQSSQDLVICEFEENSECFPLPADLNDEKVFPTTPTRTIDNEVSPEERIKSTTSMSEPLRVLQLARRSHRKRLGSMEMYNAMTQTQQQLGGAKTIDSLLDIVVGLVAELTGFHRVMIYRFDNYKNGCVVSELIDPKASDDLFRGLNFPASDIPKQARDLYIINRIRVLYDRDEESARFLGRDPTDFDKPLDLTHSYLRAMSPIHLKYLTNMGVRSSMSISIVIDNDLWGLVTCHHYGHKAIRVSLPIRELCRNIGECASTNIDRLLMLKRLQARKPPSTILPRQNPSGFLTASSTDLLRVFDADFGLLSIQDEVRAIGRLDPYREALALLAHLKSNRMPEIIASQNVNEDFKDLKYAPGIHTIAGLLFIPLTMGGNDFIVFFRKGQLREVRWAGNPYEKVTKLGSLYLEPRGSFKRWTESVVDLSMEWTEDQMDTAFILKDFMDVWRSKESTGQKNRMTRLLLQNSSHEVRTPLNAIVNYLEIGLESAIDDATREILEKAYKASKSLIYVIDDLLNLTKVEDGRVASVHEILDLTTTVSDVITPFRKEAMRKNLDLTVSTHPGIPEMVKGDSARLRQTLSNIISNAFQNSDEGGIKVDIRPLKIREDSSIIEITVQDAGIGMSEKQLDDLFQEFEQVLGDEDNRSSTASTPASAGEPVIKEPLGLGLAVVARYVRNMNGQIRVRSQLGKGTIFGIELPFEHAHQRPESIPSGLSSPEQSVASLRRSSVENVSLGKKDSLEGFIPELVRAAEGSITSSRSGWAEGTTSTATTTPIKAPLEFFPDTQKINPPIEPLSVLIAEDNPINAKIMSRRLSKVGHTIEIASDGQTCHDYFVSKPESVDVILMDLQMPLVDGHQATRMIRRVEKSLEELRKIRPRVPIMAVSASLTEESRFEYIECGFDAWILKPVDFSRLDFLLRGIENPEFRQQAQYKVGFWDKGGWFFS